MGYPRTGLSCSIRGTWGLGKTNRNLHLKLRRGARGPRSDTGRDARHTWGWEFSKGIREAQCLGQEFMRDIGGPWGLKGVGRNTRRARGCLVRELNSSSRD